MQNTPQAYRGAGAPSVNFAENTYDNRVGSHCQVPGYPPYANAYHPAPSPRPHHYGNHQMQQNMPYRHHTGAYAPNHNQYAQNMNQDVYRNHHSGYVGNSNTRNIPAKSWSENNASPDLMSYGQPHPQMMNNPPQMPVNSMRSPPHAASNMNPNQPPNQQHYRQMQSPAHSPHSWSQAQIPSPGVMHSSRTTPSPLPTHVRSPGHSQPPFSPGHSQPPFSPGHSQPPFSPPAAHPMNMPSHLQPLPENGQIPPSINAPVNNDNHNPSNPLHSLQKMVMLEQDPSKSLMPMIEDENDQFSSHCDPHSYSHDEDLKSDSKDSAYSTYYNMDENRFESKPNNTINDSAYSTVQQVSNCDFPLPSQPLNSEEVKNPTGLANASNLPEVFHPSNPSSSTNLISSAPLSHTKSDLSQNNCTMNFAECPPHAESAPVFADPTKELASTNSEQALESLNPKWDSNATAENVPSDDAEKLGGSNVSENNSVVATAENVPSDNAEKLGGSNVSENNSVVETNVVNGPTVSPSKIKCENSKEDKEDDSSTVQLDSDSNGVLNNPEKTSSKNEKDSKLDALCKEVKSVKSECVEDKKPSVSIIRLTAEIHNTDKDMSSHSPQKVKEEIDLTEDSVKPTLRKRKACASYEETPSPEPDLKYSSFAENHNPKKYKETKMEDCNPSTNSDSADSKTLKDSALSPVKVVIHRIRKSDVDDSWQQVPVREEKESSDDSVIEIDCEEIEEKPETKASTAKPKVIILSSPAMSQKRFGFRSSVANNNIVTFSEDSTAIESIDIEDDANDNADEKESIKSSIAKSRRTSPDKKRGRPVGSKNKSPVKKRRGKRGCRKKRGESPDFKSKSAELPSKQKKTKIHNGPYVRILGNKKNPSTIKVVNDAQREEEKLSKNQPKRNFSQTISRIKKKNVCHLSTLSPTYDAFNRDKTWLCVFCHKGSHIAGMGDLYGPYYIKDENSENSKSASTPSTPGSSRGGKKRKIDSDESKSTKKSKQSSAHSSIVSTPLNTNQDAASMDDMADLQEVWIHEDCVIWCQNVSMYGEDVQGLEESVAEASEHNCSKCSLNGATLGCWGKGCKQQYHFCCAKEIGCQIDTENFSLLCPTHKKKSPRQ